MKNPPTMLQACKACDGFGFAWIWEENKPLSVNQCLICHGKGFK
jgi:excinuclease UvrABC ATPase subunit